MLRLNGIDSYTKVATYMLFILLQGLGVFFCHTDAHVPNPVGLLIFMDLLSSVTMGFCLVQRLA